MSDTTPSPAPSRWHLFAGPADELVLRALFAAMLAATVAVLYVDYSDFSAKQAERARIAPSAEPFAPKGAPTGAMSFELVDGGKLMATGTIMPDSAKAFAAEVEKHGAYIKTVVLQSPGGSVQDAMEIGRLIRAKNFATEVTSGHVCASSCPLVFAGGVTRRAGARAQLGVHQMVAAGPRELIRGDGMADAQRITAQVQNYLRDMGIDLALWVKAMETPNARLYDLTPAEMLEFKLATEVESRKAPGGKTKT
jgi:hypothetical protein